MKCETEWKDIKGYEGLYQVSNTGEVRSLDRVVLQKRESGIIEKRLKGKILNKWIAKNYYHVTLSKNGQIYAPFVHKLVAEEFVDNPNGYAVVNHIDEDKTNNNASNLEWCTQKYNRNYGNAEIKRLQSFISSKSTHNIKHKGVIQYDKNGNEINRYFSIQEATKDGFLHACICNCCQGRRKTHKGYIWKYED